MGLTSAPIGLYTVARLPHRIWEPAAAVPVETVATNRVRIHRYITNKQELADLLDVSGLFRFQKPLHMKL